MSKEFNEWKESRKVTSIDQLPSRLQDQLKEFIELYNPSKIWIYGSYYNGDWIDIDTPQYYRNLKKQIKYKDKISDLDIIVEPPIEITTFKDLHINQTKHKNSCLIFIC